MQNNSAKIIKYALALVLAAAIVVGAIWVFTGKAPWTGKKTVEATSEQTQSEDTSQSSPSVTTDAQGMIDLSGSGSGPLEDTDTVPFDGAEITKPEQLPTADAEKIGEVATAFTKGAWDRPATDKTSADSLIRMWEKYGCESSKETMIAALKEFPDPPMKAWAQPDGKVTVTTGHLLLNPIASEDGAVYYMEATVPFDVYLASDPDNPVFDGRRYDQYQIADVDGTACVVNMGGFSWEWAAPPASDE